MAAYTELRIAGLSYGGSAWGRSDSQIDLFNSTDRVPPIQPTDDGSHVYRITVGELRRRLNAIGYTPQSVQATVYDIAEALLKEVPKDSMFDDSRQFLRYVQAQSVDDLIELVRSWRLRVERNEDEDEEHEMFDLGRTTDFPTALLQLIQGGSPDLALADHCPMYGHAFECLLCEVFEDDESFEFDWTCVADGQSSPATFDPIGQRYDDVLAQHGPGTLVRGSIFWEEEGDLWEFKSVSAASPPKAITGDLARYAIGFLNRFGGTLLFGVADNGKVEGVTLGRDDRDELDKRVKAVLTTISPAVPLAEFTLEFRPVIGAANLLPQCYVVALKIPAGKADEMYFKEEKTWVRVGKETRLLSGHALFAHVFATYRCGSRKLQVGD